MQEKGTIYTYGHTNIKPSSLLSLLKQHNINCVVDCRISSNRIAGINSLLNELEEALKQQQITYLPFFNNFGFIPSQATNKKGNIIYSKAIIQPEFQQGVERISNGVKKGYRICIIDNQKEISKSKRFLLIGKFLKDKYSIIHLCENGHYFSQEQIEQRNIEKAERRKQQNIEKQKVGYNGEEIAALYLVENGFQIIDRNWNLHHGCELDIVALKNNRIHFIEVKTRTSDKYGEPQTAINRQKMKNIAKAINTYRYRRYLYNTEYQIDSIAIIYHSEENYELKHFLNIRPDGGACDECNTFHKKPHF